MNAKLTASRLACRYPAGGEMISRGARVSNPRGQRWIYRNRKAFRDRIPHDYGTAFQIKEFWRTRAFRITLCVSSRKVSSLESRYPWQASFAIRHCEQPEGSRLHCITPETLANFWFKSCFVVEIRSYLKLPVPARQTISRVTTIKYHGIDWFAL